MVLWGDSAGKGKVFQKVRDDLGFYVGATEGTSIISGKRNFGMSGITKQIQGGQSRKLSSDKNALSGKEGAMIKSLPFAGFVQFEVKMAGHNSAPWIIPERDAT